MEILRDEFAGRETRALHQLVAGGFNEELFSTGSVI